MPRSLAYEKKTITAMVDIYCRGHHAGEKGSLCQNCRQLLQYALKRLDKCPFGPEKGPCSKCKIHCYEPSMREQIREVMQYSGPRMLSRHPVLAADHLLKGWKHKEKKRK